MYAGWRAPGTPLSSGGEWTVRTVANPTHPHLDLGGYLPYLINRVGAALVQNFTPDIAGSHLSIAMWRVLAALSNNGEQRQIDLADMTSTDASTLSRLVSRLVRSGLVTRSRSARNNREVVVALSAEGAALSERLIPIAVALEQTATQGLSDQELEVVRRALRKMYENMEQGRRAPR
jgi:DNA-binding MarR family transcriptional regulator